MMSLLVVDDFVLKPVSRNDIQEILTKLIVSVKADRQRQKAYNTVVQLTRDENAQIRDNEYTVVIQQVLDRELANPAFSLAQLAQEVALSQTYLSTLFRQIFGIPWQPEIMLKSCAPLFLWGFFLRKNESNSSFLPSRST